MPQYSRSSQQSLSSTDLSRMGRSLKMNKTRRARPGFTLLEVLIATAVTLLMMISLAQIFKVLGDSMQQGRAALELNNRLRSVALRIRADVENLTTTPDPPANPSEGQGYLELYDGGMTDFSANSFNTALSRFGDLDDILMGTVQARDVWFTGKVPRYVLTATAAAPNPDLTTDLNGNLIADDLELITIAAQHAEIALFVQPLVAGSSTVLPAISNPLRDPSYLAGHPEFFQDDDTDGVPDGYRLHYRVLLVRPDLNLPNGLLPATAPSVAADILRVGPQTIALPNGSSVALPTPMCDMSAAHTLCDLSIRRVYNPSDGLSGTDDYIAANSLEDLVDPANRFAHVQIPIPGTNSTTMPLLALGQALSAVYTSEPDGLLGSNNFLVGSGFLHPAFQLQHPPGGAAGMGLTGQPTRFGEDILASDILAFDVKGFDTGVPLLPSFGADGSPGIASFDDDGNGTMDDASEFGAEGSDDLVLSPNDPGYAAVLGATPIGTGEFVDLGWGRKVVLHYLNELGFSLPPPANTNLWSQLSGYSSASFASGGASGFTTGLFGSGKALTNSSGVIHVFQPSFDTWTSAYEGDGILQAYRTGRNGVTRISGNLALYGIGGLDTANAVPAWRQFSVDASTDGIDNNGVGGVDDVSELETLAPFPVKLRGFKVSIRMEEPNTRQLRQMSVAKEFVSQ